jgi:hypothetical protein
VECPEGKAPRRPHETNFNVTSNQASDSGKAPTELMNNMVDAVRASNTGLFEAIDPSIPVGGAGTL